LERAPALLADAGVRLAYPFSPLALRENGNDKKSTRSRCLIVTTKPSLFSPNLRPKSQSGWSNRIDATNA
jgi:hypothetical protein